MNWLKAVAIAKMHGETVPRMHQVPIPELLGLPEIADGGDNDVLESGKRLYAQGDYNGAYQRFMKVLMRDSKNSEAQQYLKMTVRQMSIGGQTTPISPLSPS
jgi:hypothetical protein